MSTISPGGADDHRGCRVSAQSGQIGPAGQLIAAAERLIAEHGYLAVRLEDIGAAAGVSGPAIYRHFPNKEALLVELLVGISTRLLAGARTSPRGPATPNPRWPR